MKYILIIGASGSLARYLINELKAATDLHLTLFVRNKKRRSGIELDGFDIVEGDVMDYGVLKNAVEGNNIVYGG